MNFSTPVHEIPKVGPAYKKKLNALNINTVGDILFFFPVRYEDFSKVTPVSLASPGRKQTFKGVIEEVSSGKTPRRRIPYASLLISDNTGKINVLWLNQAYLSKTFREGESIFLSGKVSYSKGGPQLVNPSYEKADRNIDSVHTARIVPFYPETKGISSRWFRFVLKFLLRDSDISLKETLPEQVLEENRLPFLREALEKIHFPESTEDIKKSRKRFSFERIFLLQLLLLQKKIKLAKSSSVPIKTEIEKVQDLVSGLPYTLTDAQKKSAWQILRDMEKDIPMNRLLEGDVGSGKTVVAVIASLVVIRSGYQVAFMAPTEVLARQHFDEVAKLLWRFKVDVGLLTGKKDKLRSKKLKGDTVEISRQKLIEKSKEGKIDILIGTHTLIQEKVRFKDLALVILDEQHRFGVSQRAKLCLKEKAGVPHLLSMTATPIPRTLALTLYGDLDISVINEMPGERKKVITKIITPGKREKAYEFIRKEVKEGRQAFFICPRIEVEKEKDNSPWSGLKAVEEEKEKLAKQVFPDLRVEMLHGKMKTTEKDRTMKDFKNKKADILVSTSVVEVGIDIKNASVMVIEGAEMFGLAQLHQFRGRVGRSNFQSYCFLFTNSGKKKTRQRLSALLSAENGFQLAEKDLEIRGPGDFFGRRQWGLPDFTMDALKDKLAVENAREAAKKFLAEDVNLKKHPLLKKRVDLLEKKIHLE